VVTPGNAFCSCIRVGIPSLEAALTVGQETYPPVPITRSGENFLIIFLAAETEVNAFQAALIFLGVSLREKPETSTNLMSYPAL